MLSFRFTSPELRTIVFVFSVLAAPIRLSNAQERPDEHIPQQNREVFMPFEAFLERVKAARFEEYRRLPDARVESPEAFDDMRAHILRMYEGVSSVGSFVLDGQIADCIPVRSQPTVRQLHIEKIEKPPVGSTFGQRVPVREPGSYKYVESPLKLGLKDRFGNAIS